MGPWGGGSKVYKVWVVEVVRVVEVIMMVGVIMVVGMIMVVGAVSRASQILGNYPATFFCI